MKLFKKLFTLLIATFAVVATPISINQNYTKADAINDSSMPYLTTPNTVELNNFASGDIVPVGFENGLDFQAFQLEIRYDKEKVNVKLSSVNMYGTYDFDDSVAGRIAISGSCIYPGLYNDFINLYVSSLSLDKEFSSYIDVIVIDIVDKNLNSVNCDGISIPVNFTLKKEPGKEDLFTCTGDFYWFKKGEEGTLSIYAQDLNRLASASFAISYDKNLISFKDYQKLGYFSDGDYWHINTNQEGFIYFSFIKNTNGHTTAQIASFTFICKAEKKAYASIKVEATDVCDYNSSKIQGQVSNVDIQISNPDNDYVRPSLFLNCNVTNEGKTAEVIVGIDEDSHLGATDIIFTFQGDYVTYKNYETLFKPASGQYITVNTKNLINNQIKISIISTKDIVDKVSFCKFNFEIEDLRIESSIYVTAYPSNTTDAMGTILNISSTGETFILQHNVHDWTETVLQEPTCTEKGSKRKECSVGGETIIVDIPALGHSLSDWVIVKQPTSTEEGLKVRKCTRCNYEESAVIPCLLSPEESKVAEDFAKDFLKLNICGTDDHTEANSQKFLSMKYRFNQLSEKIKNYLRETNGNQYSENLIEQMLAKYDRIISLYNRKYPDKFEDYMGRLGTPNFHESMAMSVEDINMYGLIYSSIVVFVIIAFSLIIIFTLKKKKAR